MSVSPVDNIGNQGLNVGDEDEDLDAEVDEETVEAFGICGDRLGLEKEDAGVRRLVDPKLPTQEEVDAHYLMGAPTLSKLVSHLCARQRKGFGPST